MAPHSSTLAWKIPWAEEPSGLRSMGSLGVGHGWMTSLSRIGEGNGNPLQCSCLENPRDGGAWWAAVYEVAQSRTRLKQLSSAVSSLLSGLVSSCGERRLLSGWGAQACLCSVFSWAARSSGHVGSVIAALGLLEHRLSSCSPRVWLPAACGIFPH